MVSFLKVLPPAGVTPSGWLTVNTPRPKAEVDGAPSGGAQLWLHGCASCLGNRWDAMWLPVRLATSAEYLRDPVNLDQTSRIEWSVPGHGPGSLSGGLCLPESHQETA